MRNKRSLYFGMPNRRMHTIKLSAAELHHRNYNFRISLVISGGLSPAKSCYYEFNLQNKKGSGKFQFNETVIKYFENKTFKEQQEELGTTRESFYKSVLKR